MLTPLGRLRRLAGGFYATAGALLSAGFLLTLLGLLTLSVLTEDVLEGETIRTDRAALLWLDTRATPRLDRVALEVTALGDTLVVMLVAIVAGSFLWLLERKAYALLLASAVLGASIISSALKELFDRQRPTVFEWRTQYAETSASYPSGHATMSMVTLVVVAYVVHRLSGRRSVGVVAMLLAGLVILLIGLSRLYLGVHYPSDVIAGYVVGFAWAVFCALSLEVLSRRFRGAPPEEAAHPHS